MISRQAKIHLLNHDKMLMFSKYSPVPSHRHVANGCSRSPVLYGNPTGPGGEHPAAVEREVTSVQVLCGMWIQDICKLLAAVVGLRMTKTTTKWCIGKRILVFCYITPTHFAYVSSGGYIRIQMKTGINICCLKYGKRQCTLSTYKLHE